MTEGRKKEMRCGFLMHLAVGAGRWLGAAGRNGRRGFFIGIRRENRLEVDV
jgi:hypothetical protein